MLQNVLILFLLLLLTLNSCHSFSGGFWHICDIHLNRSSSASHHNRVSYGNYLSDTSLSLLQSAIRAMKDIEGHPDFIIWNGDNVAHKKMNDENFFKTIQNVSQELFAQFPSTNILPSLGNHDLNPSDQIAENSTWCKELLKSWKLFFRNNTVEMDTFERGCYYSRIVNLHNESRKIIVLNTIIWYSKNRETFNLTDPYGQFEWLKNELRDARNKALKVFIVGHVPPGASEYSPQTYKHLHPGFNKQILDILQNNSDIIEVGFFSHQHTDSFKIVYDYKDKPAISLFLSPSVTPYNLWGLGSVNPSIRLYTWPTNVTNRLYSQYHTKLPEEGSDRSPIWSLEYNSTDMLPSLSPSKLDLLLADFSSQKSLYFTKFFEHHLSGRPHENNETCPINSSCRCNIICGMRNIDYLKLDICLTGCTTQVDKTRTIGQVPMIVSVIVLFTVILIAVIFGVNKVYCHQRRSASLTRDIFMATYNGKDCEQIVADHIDNIAEVTFGDVPEYRGHMRDNSRTILTLNDDNEITTEKSQPSSISKFAISNKSKSQEKYDYSRM